LLTAAERVVLLLRTFYEAREYWDARSGGDGPQLMPSVWREGSYIELERRLADLRDGADRQLWFHATRRYRDGEIVSLEVPVRRTVRGPTFTLPPCCELVAGAVKLSDERTLVRCYRWRSDVDEALAAGGVLLLTELMYDGRRDKIVVPDVFHRRALGLPPKDEKPPGIGGGALIRSRA
jgi:hypothetical protein